MPAKNPLISINLPTFNGADSIKRALDSVKAQTYKNYEIVIVDHYSTDKTIEIAKKYTNRIYFDKKRILNSREIGLKKSKGEIILFLSCDQVLTRDLLERTVKLFNEKDVNMIINEERANNPKTIIEKLTDIDKKVIHEDFEIDPTKSVLLPSTFKKDILVKVFKKFTEPMYETITIHDHAIIYYEAYKLSRKVGYLKNAVYHNEPRTAKELFQHYYSWGRRAKAAREALSREHYEMFENKLKQRLKRVRILDGDCLRALPIIFLKGAGYRLGYYFSK